MLVASVWLTLLLVICMPAIRSEDTNVTFSFKSRRNELGDNVQYEVRVFPSHGNDCHEHDLLAEEVLFSVSSDVENHSLMITKPNFSHFYCVRVTPVKKNHERCQICESYVHQQIIPVFRVKRGLGMHLCNSSCLDWNITYRLKPVANKLVLNFESTGALQCFDNFHFVLYWVGAEVDVCKDENVANMEEKISNASTTLNFEGLIPGNYCVEVTPYHDCCDFTGYCVPQYTQIVNLRASENVWSLPRSSEPVEKPWFMITIICLAVSLCIMCAVLVVIRFRRAQHTPPKRGYSIGTLSQAEYCDTPVTKVTNKPKVITVLYPIETKEIEDCVKALVHFLRVNYQLTIRVDFLDRAGVYVCPAVWYSQGDVFLVVETEGAAFREENHKVYHHKDNDALDPHFMYAYNRLISISDSKSRPKIVVVHFSFTPDIIKLKSLPLHERYVITKDLHRLCYFLSHGEEWKFNIEGFYKFISDFEENEQLLALNRAITRATEFVTENPDYVRDIFKV